MNLENIKLSTCAYFYRLRDSQTLSDADIRQMLCNVTAEKVKQYAVNKCRHNGPSGTKFSIRVFKNTPSKPSFFEISENGWKEQKIGYFLFIEYQEYVAVLRKYCTLPKFISDKLEGIDYSTLVSLHAQNDTSYQKVSMQNLDGADYALRNKSYEGLDLKNNVSPIGASHYYVRTIKGANGDDRFALTLYSSRINEFVPNMTVKDICEWVKDIVDKIIEDDAESGTFLSMFAKPQKYSDEASVLEPRSLLVFYGLISMLKDNPNVNFVYVGKNGTERIVGNDVIQKYIDSISRAYTSVNVKESEGKCRYFVGHNDNIEIVKRKNDIVLKNGTWKKIKIKGTVDDEYDGTLCELINRHNQFNVYFSQAELIYSNKKLFRNSKLIGSIPQLIKVLKDWPELENVHCEKYSKEKNLNELQGWDEGSIFRVVEDKMTSLGYEYLICDDCKKEWADHIAIKHDAVCFLAEKYKKSLHSASDFQDVVGQALKNLGNMTPTNNAIIDKKKDWSNPYLTSEIPRYRSAAGDVNTAVELWTTNVSGPGFRRELALVVNFLSKKDFETNLNLIVSGGLPPHEAEAFQRLWLLSTFVSSCMEMGVVPIIYCKP